MSRFDPNLKLNNGTYFEVIKYKFKTLFAFIFSLVNGWRTFDSAMGCIGATLIKGIQVKFITLGQNLG